MNYLLRFLQRFHLVLIFLMLFVASFWLYVDTSYYQKASFGKFANRIAGSISTQFMSLGQYMRLKGTNLTLHEENILLKNELERYKNVLSRGGLISKVDSLADRTYTYISARVVNNSTSRHNNYITLNVGLDDGVHDGMGVVCADGVVGIVASASDNFATVISLLNSNTKISAKHKKSGAFGSLLWDGVDYREVLLTDIPLHVQLAQGDTVVTSGYSALFPRDIPIGAILHIAKDKGNAYSIGVQLYADFKRLDYVYVINATDNAERTQLETKQ